MSEPRRVRPPRRNLGNTDNKVLDFLVMDAKVFDTKQKALMFAAALGAHIEKREAVKSTEEGIRWQIFETQGDNAFIYALAVAETEGLEVLNDADAGDAYVTIFEEYANAGLIYIDEQILSKPVDPLDALISLLLDIRSREDKVVSGLEGITSEQLSALGL